VSMVVVTHTHTHAHTHTTIFSRVARFVLTGSQKFVVYEYCTGALASAFGSGVLVNRLYAQFVTKRRRLFLVGGEHNASCHESCVFSRAKLEVSTGVNGRRACGSISGLRLRFYFLSFVGVL
jgi:hypothetical protein